MCTFAELVGVQLDYLNTFRRLVAETAANRPQLSDGARATVVEETRRLYPDYPYVSKLPNLIELNADAVAHELAAPCP